MFRELRICISSHTSHETEHPVPPEKEKRKKPLSAAPTARPIQSRHSMQLELPSCSYCASAGHLSFFIGMRTRIYVHAHELRHYNYSLGSPKKKQERSTHNRVLYFEFPRIRNNMQNHAQHPREPRKSELFGGGDQPNKKLGHRVGWIRDGCFFLYSFFTSCHMCKHENVL